MPLSLYTARMTEVYKQKVIIAGKVGMHTYHTTYDYIHNHPNKTHNKYQGHIQDFNQKGAYLKFI